MVPAPVAGAPRAHFVVVSRTGPSFRPCITNTFRPRVGRFGRAAFERDRWDAADDRSDGSPEPLRRAEETQALGKEVPHGREAVEELGRELAPNEPRVACPGVLSQWFQRGQPGISRTNGGPRCFVRNHEHAACGVGRVRVQRSGFRAAGVPGLSGLRGRSCVPNLMCHGAGRPAASDRLAEARSSSRCRRNSSPALDTKPDSVAVQAHLARHHPTSPFERATPLSIEPDSARASWPDPCWSFLRTTDSGPIASRCDETIAGPGARCGSSQETQRLGRQGHPRPSCGAWLHH